MGLQYDPLEEGFGGAEFALALRGESGSNGLAFNSLRNMTEPYRAFSESDFFLDDFLFRVIQRVRKAQRTVEFMVRRDVVSVNIK